jgi:hypothetical protein
MIPQFPQDKDVQTIFLGVILAIFGGIASFLHGHEGKDLSMIDFIKALLAKIIIVAFIGTVMSLVCSSLNIGARESGAIICLAGFFNREALILLKKWFKKRLES